MDLVCWVFNDRKGDTGYNGECMGFRLNSIWGTSVVCPAGGNSSNIMMLIHGTATLWWDFLVGNKKASKSINLIWLFTWAGRIMLAFLGLFLIWLVRFLPCAVLPSKLWHGVVASPISLFFRWMSAQRRTRGPWPPLCPPAIDCKVQMFIKVVC